jgi:polar amino acid transport system substrate-binding protein
MTLRRKCLMACLATLIGLTIGTAAHAQDNAVLRVATDATFPPMEFVENGKRTGFDVELVEAMAKTMGKRVEWTDIDFKGLIPGLVSRRFDMAVSGIYITPERRKVVDFTEPYYTGGLVALVKSGNTSIHAPADLNGKKVSVQVGTKSVSFLRDTYPQVQRVEVEKNQEMFNLVEIGRADAAVRMVEQPLTTEEYGMAVRKDTPELTRALNAALAKVKADGTYARLTQKWFGTAAK